MLTWSNLAKGSLQNNSLIADLHREQGMKELNKINPIFCRGIAGLGTSECQVGGVRSGDRKHMRVPAPLIFGAGRN